MGLLLSLVFAKTLKSVFHNRGRRCWLTGHPCALCPPAPTRPCGRGKTRPALRRKVSETQADEHAFDSKQVRAASREEPSTPLTGSSTVLIKYRLSAISYS